MKVLKQGTGHKEQGINCQDAVAQYDNIIKVVCDGCSEGEHSEIGAALFAKLVVEKFMLMLNKGKRNIDVKGIINSTMDDIIKIIGTAPIDIKDYASFTILVAIKYPEENYTTVYYCGDGYIITKKDNDINYIKLDDGKYPKYLCYNYVDSIRMKEYGEGVDIDTMIIEDVDSVGLSSDGIRFIVDSDNEEIKKEFSSLICMDKEIRMKLFFNRHEDILQDDFSIVM